MLDVQQILSTLVLVEQNFVSFLIILNVVKISIKMVILNIEQLKNLSLY